MKIFIDHQAFSIQKYGGVSRIFAELTRYFSTNPYIQVFTPYLLMDNEYFHKLSENISNFINRYRFANKIFKFSIPLVNNYFSLLTVRKSDFDIYFPSYYDNYFLKKTEGKVIILFVYDMIHELYRDIYGEQNTVSKKKHLLMVSSTKIIAISQNTKKDILQLYPDISDKKIEVVHLSHSLQKQFSASLADTLPKDYILFVGTRKHYKNFISLYKAFKIVLKKYGDLKLLCVGGGPFTDGELKVFKEDMLSDSILQMNIGEADLFQVYNSSLTFVFPSLYEGFGIPVVEAMYAECPVILGNLSSFPEIAGDAGVYCNVEDENDIAEKIFLIIENKELRDLIIKKGSYQASRFSWKYTADSTMQICNDALALNQKQLI